MPSIQDLASEIMGWISPIDYLLAQKLVNRAWFDIRDARFWSFLRGFGVLVVPQIITAGTVTVTQYSATVTLDATANAVLNNLTNSLITQRQFRCAQGPLYNIAGYDNAGLTLTLDRPYMENNLSAASYAVYQCYYQPQDSSGALITDFLKFKVILSPVQGYAITGPNLNITRQELDARDPTRGSAGIPYCVAGFVGDSSGVPFYELWPHPTSNAGLPYLYQKRGVDLTGNVQLPTTFNSNLVVEHALSYACDWAIENVGKFPELKGVDWRLAKAEHERKYKTMLQAAKISDDNLMSENLLPNLQGYMGVPILDAAWMQSHSWGEWLNS